MSDDTIFIKAYAVPNAANSREWLPVYTVNGHLHGSTYATTGYSADEALTIARQMADEEAKRYIGDWNVIVVTKPVREDAND